MDMSYFKIGAVWPPKEEEARLSLYTINRTLYEGEHAMIHKDRWLKLFRDEEEASYEIDINLNRRLTTLFADLLFGQDPTFTATNDDELTRLLSLGNSGSFLVDAYEVAVDMSRYGIGIFKAFHDGVQARVEAQPPQYWFPVVDPMNVKQVTSHIIAFEYLIGLDHYLKVEEHTTGMVVEQTFALSRDGAKIIGAEDEPFGTETGADNPLIFPCVNGSTSDSLYGKDDYSDVDSILTEMEVRHGQASRILDKNADPVLIGPRSAIKLNPITGKAYTEVVGGKYIGATRDDIQPAYLTWDGSLMANNSELASLMELFYVLSETSPAAFGKLEQGLATSGSALRRLLIPTLAKVKRMKQAMVPAMIGVLKAAAQLDVKQRTLKAAVLDDLTIAMHDGIPVDPDEQVDVEAKLNLAGLTSKRSSLMRLFDMTAENADAELLQIEAEKPPAPPSPFDGFGGNVPPVA